MSDVDKSMSSAAEPEFEPDFDLEKHFLPEWAKRPPGENRYADYEGEPEEAEGRRRARRDRAARRPDAAPSTEVRASQPRRGPDKAAAQKPAERQRRAPAPKPQEELPPINVAFVPDDKGVESLTRQIRITGRAYPLFEIAQMILEKPERYSVTLSVRKKPDGTVLQPMFVCALDDTVWLSEDEAVHWTLDQHFNTFYQAERTRIDPPKGTYTFVAVCGLSGVVLGPPNYHGYQEALRKLHAARFSRMPFEAYKARVKIVRDEAVVKQWLEEQSWRTEYICLNVPEPLKLPSWEQVEQHFRQVHAPTIIRQAETVRLSGPASRRIRQPALARLVRTTWEQQRRFPLQVATVLSQQFGARHLQFFKANRSVTYVAVARPRYLDLESEPVSESVRRIVQFINEHPKCTRRELLAALAPRPAVTESVVESGSTEGTATEPTPEETQVIADLHWLVHQGHVIEFANGILETAKKPASKPKTTPQPAATATATEATQQPASDQVSQVPEAETAFTESAGSAVAPTAQSQPEANAARGPGPEAAEQPKPIAGLVQPSPQAQAAPEPQAQATPAATGQPADANLAVPTNTAAPTAPTALTEAQQDLAQTE